MKQEKSSTQARVRVITLDKDAKKVQVASTSTGQIKKASSPVKTTYNIPFSCC